MGKKNLDKMFQEKFKGFSEQPDEQVWQHIETSLNEKKKRRILFPIWWKLGGVAAVLLMGLFLWNPFEENTANTTITDSNNSPVKIKTKEDNPSENTTIDQKKPVFVNSDNEKTAVTTNHSSDNNTLVRTKEHGNETLNNSSSLGNTTNQIASKLTTATTLSQQDNTVTSNSETIVDHSDIAKNEVTNSSKERLPSAIDNSKNLDAIVLKKNSHKAIASDSIKKNSIEVKINPKKKSIFDEIAAQEEDENTIAKNSDSKWSAGPSIAPIYYDAIGQGSPVHSIFVPNSKSGDVSLSYGLSVAYEVSKKLSIRSGLHKVDYGYNTNDIQFSSSLDAASSSKIDNVDFANSARNLFVGSNATNVEGFSQNSFLDTSSEFSSSVNARNGIMEQQLEYLELPLELNYALIDKKFGVNLIGGVSSLFLVDNLIQLTSGDLTTEVGEANNINKVNFSTNIGFGLNYSITPKMKFNVEPMFKYQLNTFSQTEGTFRPFSVGVYSGLNFKF